MDAKAKVFAGRVGTTTIIKLEGHATWQISTALKKYEDANLDTILQSERLIFDLTQCTFLDSTMIGLVSHLAVKFFKKSGKQASLLYAHEKVRSILELMNCHRIIALVEAPSEEAPAAQSVIELQGNGVTDKQVLRECMLLAHKALVELNEKNLSAFETVIDDLEHPSQGGDRSA